MASSPPPKPDNQMLKSFLIAILVLGLAGIIFFVMGGIGLTILIGRMFPYAEEAAKLPVNQPGSSSPNIPNEQNEPSLEIPAPLVTDNNHSLAFKKAMTWRVLNTATINGKQYALFGSDEFTNPYEGDTHIKEVRPLLCLQKSNLPQPLGLPSSTTTPGGALRGSWSGGRAMIVPDISGKTLTSQVIADEKCRLQQPDTVGENNFRMAEFHDGDQLAGWAGWDFWAEVSSLESLENPNIRYWVQINDQPANPW